MKSRASLCKTIQARARDGDKGAGRLDQARAEMHGIAVACRSERDRAEYVDEYWDSVLKPGLASRANVRHGSIDEQVASQVGSTPAS